MSITTYSELKTAVANWLHRTGETGLDDRIDEGIDLLETKLGLRLRIAAMETSADLTVSAQSVNAPTGFRGVRRIYLETSPVQPLHYLTPHAFFERYLSSETNKPEAYTIEGDSAGGDYNIIFGPAPDVSYTGKILYYKAFTPLDDSNTTNWLLTNAPGIYLYGTLVEMAAFLYQPPADLVKWAQMLDALLADLQEDSRRVRYPDTGPAMRPYGVTIR